MGNVPIWDALVKKELFELLGFIGLLELLPDHGSAGVDECRDHVGGDADDSY